MIAFLRGRIHTKTENSLTLDVDGVGYEVFLSKTALILTGETGAEAAFEIYTHFTESNLQLFGFPTATEKSVFKKLISVSGIGPKMGLSILSAYPFEHLITCIVQGDLAALTNISGIGKKTAERLVIELKDKFKDMPARAHEGGGFKITRVAVGSLLDPREDEAIQALVSLGYSEMSAKKALQKIGIAADDTVQILIKKSLGAITP